jgi:hypothetical protein
MPFRLISVLALSISTSLIVWAAPATESSWVKGVSIKKHQDEECLYVDLAFRQPTGAAKRYKGLLGEPVILEKQKRLIVISTCPMVSPEHLYFFNSQGVMLKKIEMKYGGITDYRFDEQKGHFIIQYGKYSPTKKRSEETLDCFDVDGNLVSQVPSNNEGNH